ncbi:phosphonate C-P lyase system protein PhnH [Kaistia nematophila]|uniref:Phosphonate C-P lyase system protein PhnH n=1 Tax=Kaistia nematophila TaxID=2994654 RepID=A0A9X3IMZ5_9HYPH|nr:phosphonate C-P lyase system protein PhnH [Kaistia nematophila]MCX5571041.1 phosphonate C-P lyase system protein PhnH [Kaistia nematophila]
MSALAITAGFTDPVIEAQAHFHALMNALARPGTIQPFPAALDVPAPLTPELAAVALTLVDHEATLWLDATLAASQPVVDYIRFHTGARIVADPADAAFALVVDVAAMPSLASFAQGTDEYPDRSTTIILAAASIEPEGSFELSGPGIRDSARIGLSPVPADFTAQLAINRAQFPRGVDLVFAAGREVAALPRTTLVSEV